MQNNNLNRRQMMALIGGGLAATAIVPGTGLAASGVRRLALQNLHTGEQLTAVYWVDGQYRPDALRAFARICRDFRTGDVHAIDRRVFDLVHRIGALIDDTKSIQLISGYRSPRTNARLSAHSSSVAKRSLHMQGKALDFRIPGIPARTVYKAARSLNAGGAGLYSRSNFVHVDVGRPRFWGS